MLTFDFKKINLPPGSKVLDVGCGEGRHIFGILDEFKDVHCYGLDQDIPSLEKCKELINVKTRQYAKRQNTWARGHMKNWNKLYSKDFTILLKKTLKVIS